jgi:hypothetical protein
MESGEAGQKGGSEAKPETIKANDNAWYLLAALYGEPKRLIDFDLRDKNRIAWNRYVSQWLDDSTRTKLIEEGRHEQNELKAFKDVELREIENRFAERREARPQFSLPRARIIAFRNVEFAEPVSFRGYLFVTPADFKGAFFSDFVHFHGATFCDWVTFRGRSFVDAPASLKQLS